MCGMRYRMNYKCRQMVDVPRNKGEPSSTREKGQAHPAGFEPAAY